MYTWKEGDNDIIERSNVQGGIFLKVLCPYRSKVLGSWGWIMSIAAALSAFGSLNGTFFSGGRVCFVAAREGHMVSSFRSYGSTFHLVRMRLLCSQIPSELVPICSQIFWPWLTSTDWLLHRLWSSPQSSPWSCWSQETSRVLSTISGKAQVFVACIV